MTNRLDTQFQEYLLLIQKSKPQFNKHLRIRVDQWLKKLREKVSLDVWKKNRNTYTFLLSKCLEYNKLVPPFNKMPPQGSLPQLKQHEINEQLSVIKSENFSNICHSKFIKQARQRSQMRHKHSTQSKQSFNQYEKLLKFKLPVNISNYYSHKQKNTKETSLEASQINQTKTPNLLNRISEFLKKYEQYYKNDVEYEKIKLEISKSANSECTPVAGTTFRHEDTELKVVNPVEDEIDRSYFASSRSE